MKTKFEKYALTLGLVLVFIAFFMKATGAGLVVNAIFQNNSVLKTEHKLNESDKSFSSITKYDLSDSSSDKFTQEIESESKSSLISYTLNLLNYIFNNNIFFLTYTTYSVYVNINDRRQFLYRNISIPYV